MHNLLIFLIFIHFGVAFCIFREYIMVSGIEKFNSKRQNIHRLLK